MATHRLVFEKEIYAMEDLIAEMESRSVPHAVEELRQLRREVVALKKRVYSELTPWQTILVSRHVERPQTIDYLSLLFEEFVELHGDRAIVFVSALCRVLV
jgi:acetyl-CoA carboxylase carboxyl transferase subunit alpha